MNKQERAALVAECRASGMTAKEWCRLKGIEYRKYCDWATRVNREARQDKQEQWVDVTIAKKDGNNGAVKLHCGNLTISVEPGFNPALLLDILKVVQALC